MATTQGQNTGKAPGATAEGAPPADEFADAFAQLTQEDDASAAASAPTAGAGADAAAAGGEAAPDPGKAAGGAGTQTEGLPDPTQVGADGKPLPEPAAEGTETKEEPPAKEGAEPEPKPAGMSQEDFLAQFRDIVAGAEPKPAAKSEPASPITPFTTEENSVVEAYKKEWPDVYMAEQLIRRQEYQGIVAHIFNELRPLLGQLQQTTGAIANQSHVQQLQAAVPDYAEVAPKVMEWVNKQPAYLKGAYEAVTKTGSVQDVVDLIGRYRAETGTAKPAAAAPAPKPAAAAPAPKPVPAGVKGLAPVKSARSGVSTEVVPSDDYDAAWKAASADAA